jgi:GT2 family glycosyltransferase
MTRPVHVVVVAYHAEDSLEAALGSIGRETRVTVVDNSRSAAVAAVCERRHARYLRTEKNVGFGAGVNVALREILQGDPSDVLLLNPDSVLPEGAIAKLSGALDSNAHAGAVTPSIAYSDGRPQRVLWPFPSPAQAWREALGLSRFDRSPQFAVGTVLLLRWEALQEVGLFDERFFLYAEEADWERRARERGWHAIVCSDVVASHVGGGTSDDPSRRERLFYSAQEIYIRKWYGARGWLVYRLAVVAGAAVRAVVLPRGRRSGAARRLLIYLRGPCRAAAVRN